jgi:hypothetical protein
LRRRERHTGDACRGRAPGEVAEQDDNMQACVCGCGAGGALWNGLRELERGARGAGTQAHVRGSIGEALGDGAGVELRARGAAAQ